MTFHWFLWSFMELYEIWLIFVKFPSISEKMHKVDQFSRDSPILSNFSIFFQETSSILNKYPGLARNVIDFARFLEKCRPFCQNLNPWKAKYVRAMSLRPLHPEGRAYVTVSRSSASPCTRWLGIGADFGGSGRSQQKVNKWFLARFVGNLEVRLGQKKVNKK